LTAPPQLPPDATRESRRAKILAREQDRDGVAQPSSWWSRVSASPMGTGGGRHSTPPRRPGPGCAALAVIAMIGIPKRCIAHRFGQLGVSPELERPADSPSTIIPRSPWLASADGREWPRAHPRPRTPDLAAECPLLPMPVTRRRPLCTFQEIDRRHNGLPMARAKASKALPRPADAPSRFDRRMPSVFRRCRCPGSRSCCLPQNRCSPPTAPAGRPVRSPSRPKR
jgi:hypothetical protein